MYDVVDTVMEKMNHIERKILSEKIDNIENRINGLINYIITQNPYYNLLYGKHKYETVKVDRKKLLYLLIDKIKHEHFYSTPICRYIYNYCYLKRIPNYNFIYKFKKTPKLKISEMYYCNDLTLETYENNLYSFFYNIYMK